MEYNRLRSIAYRFPNQQAAGRELFAALAVLLEKTPGCQITPDLLTITPPYPQGAWPVTQIALADVFDPAVVFETRLSIDLRVGRLNITSPASRPAALTVPVGPPGRSGDFISPAGLVRDFQGHILRLDHTGIELPPSSVPLTRWDILISQLAKAAPLYRYPTGEPWQFVLPVDAAEWQTDISSFAAARFPKFELTYTPEVTLPLLQFHLDTDLTQVEIEDLLPSPYGFCLPGSTTSRSVYLDHPWPGLLIRIDLSYASTNDMDGWATGEWLVKEGGRIKAGDA